MQQLLFAALLSLGLIWGGSFYFIKVLLEDFGPWTIAFLRSSSGLVFVATIMLVLRKPFGFKQIAWLPMSVIALINTTIPWALIGYSETRLTSNMAAILNATTPLWTMILGMLFFGAKPAWKQWIGMTVAFLGLLVMIGIHPNSIISVDLIGFLLMLAATFCYASGSQLSKRVKALSMYQITFATLLCSSIGSGTVAFAFEPVPLAQIAILDTIVVLTGLGLFGSGIGYLLFYFMIRNGSPEFATMVTYLVPASALVWGSTLLNERVDSSLLLGLGLIFAGVFLVNKTAPSINPKSKIMKSAN